MPLTPTPWLGTIQSELAYSTTESSVSILDELAHTYTNVALLIPKYLLLDKLVTLACWPSSISVVMLCVPIKSCTHWCGQCCSIIIAQYIPVQVGHSCRSIIGHSAEN